jgi:hypothetical protein
MAACEALVAKAVADGTPIYGVTTGFGSNCGARITAESALSLGQGLSALSRLRSRAGAARGGRARGDVVPDSLPGAWLLRRAGGAAAPLGRLSQSPDHARGARAGLGRRVGRSDAHVLRRRDSGGQREVFFQGERMPASRAMELADCRLRIRGEGAHLDA